MTKEQLDAIRQRVQNDYGTKVAWAEWTQAEKDRALLLAYLDDPRRESEPRARTPTVEFMNGYVSARVERSHLLGLLHDWFRHHANARGSDGRPLHPQLDVETRDELKKLELPSVNAGFSPNR